MAGRDVPMTVRRLIGEVSLDGLNVREFCEQHGVSTWFFYDLRRRWKRDGEAALEPKSRAPKRVWNKTTADVEDLVVAARKTASRPRLGLRPRSRGRRLGGRGGGQPTVDGDCVPDPQSPR